MPALEAEPFITTNPEGAQSEGVEQVALALVELPNKAVETFT